ncbi:unnamed protein product [Hymenolepis diminuta]|uniref:Zgc:162613 n=1 Tax=Hymenolepis diminuta TaxID=6216 RepID=A0A158QDZ7_HYMDI|nr:unnamed protein product [Hymenolepis diminuta]
MDLEITPENKLESISEISVFDNYMGNLCTKYEFSTKESIWERIEYPKRTSLYYMAKSAFLPEGYPKSVSKDYLEYQIWDTVQALASSIIGALAGQAILIGVGVGDATASVLAATLIWLFKDGAGMVGRIVFAGRQGTSLDSQCKQWRIFADVLNDVAFFIELLSLHVPSLFTLIVCMSGVMRALVGMIGGATRAAITQHQALESNMADVAAKDGSQETLSNLLALFLNLILVSVVTGNLALIWLLFIILGPIHIYANWRAVRCLELTTFNRVRFNILVQDWLSRLDKKSDQVPRLLSVQEVNYLEPIISFFTQRRTIRLGCSFDSLLKAIRYCKPLPLMGVFSKERYILYCPEWKNSGYKRQHLTIYICIHSDATTEDIFKAMFHAEIICSLRHVGFIIIIWCKLNKSLGS